MEPTTTLPLLWQTGSGNNFKHLSHLQPQRDIFVLGRRISFPQRETSHKLREIPYTQPEEMMAGELKHSTIALIEDGTPRISLIPNENPDMNSSPKDVEARGAWTVIISNTDDELEKTACCDAKFLIYSDVIGHLLDYYIAKTRGCPVNKPRNLAKSATAK